MLDNEVGRVTVSECLNNGVTVPLVRIRGKYLEQLGYLKGDRLEVIFNFDKTLTIRKHLRE